MSRRAVFAAQTARSIRSLAYAASVALWASVASAGPWTLAEGEEKFFASFEYREDPAEFDARGDRADGRRQQAVSAIATEYGVTNALTLGFRTEGRWSSLESDGVDRSHSGLTETAVWLRARLWQGEVADTQAVFSGQLRGGLAGRYDPNLRPELGDGASEVELRGLAGFGFATPFGHGWAGGEAGYRYRDRDAADQLRLDGTLGVRPEALPDAMVMLEGFGTVAVGSGERSDFDLLKLAPSVGYDVTESLAFRVGVTTEVLTRNIEAGTAVNFDVWWGF